MTNNNNDSPRSTDSPMSDGDADQSASTTNTSDKSFVRIDNNRPETNSPPPAIETSASVDTETTERVSNQTNTGTTRTTTTTTTTTTAHVVYNRFQQWRRSSTSTTSDSSDSGSVNNLIKPLWRTKVVAASSPWKDSFLGTNKTKTSTATAQPLEQAALSPANDDERQTTTTTTTQQETTLNDKKEEPSFPNHDKNLVDDDEEEDGDDEDDDQSYSEEEEDYVEDESYTTNDAASSVYSSYVSDSASGVGKMAALQWAAASVVDSVQTGYFRGRYAAGTTSTTSTTNESTKNTATSSQSTMETSSSPPSSRRSLLQATPPTNNNNSNKPLVPQQHMDAQTSRILKSPQGRHIVQELLETLQPHQYIMLLGKGMLGVNLKQAFLQSSGVYVDFLVTGGAADRSKIIQVGDVLEQVGDKCVLRNTILEIPQLIANSKRPVHLIWATGWTCQEELDDIEINHMDDDMGTSTNTSPAKKKKGHSKQPIVVLHHVDVAVAMLHVIREESIARTTQTLPTTTLSPQMVRQSSSVNGSDTTLSSESLPPQVIDDAQNAETTPEEAKEPSCDTKNAEDVTTAEEEGDGGSIGSLQAEVGRTCGSLDDNNDMGVPETVSSMGSSVSATMEQDGIYTKPVKVPTLNSIDDFCSPPLPPREVRQAYQEHMAKRNNERFSVPHLCQVAATDENFRAALRNALVVCAADGRRFPFLAKHLGMQEEQRAREEQERANKGDEEGAPLDRATSSPNALLMMYAEMVQFADMYGVTPPSRRKQMADRIAHKFFLPTKLGKELIPPMFDFHQIVADASLRTLEASLDQDEIPRDLFLDFQVAALDSLASFPFVSFLVSPECARMRAYLRNTSPYVNVDLATVFESLTTSADATNYFLYVLVYLLCQTDKEGFGENDCLLAKGEGIRMEDAASSLCAAVFIRNKIVPAAQRVKSLRGDDAPSAELAEANRMVVLLFAQLWEIYVAPHIGSLEETPHSNEAGDLLAQLRVRFERIRYECETCDAEAPEAFYQLACDKLLDESNSVIQLCVSLANELVYGYATHVQPKFREHKFHEWLCAEYEKARTASIEEDKNDDEADCKTPSKKLPHLPDGCIKRLLRKAEFPAGVAPHKPTHAATTAEASTTDKAVAVVEKAETLAGASAQCALVFGTSVGLDLAAASSPAVGYNQIRRYTCQSITDTSTEEDADVLIPDVVPPTLESYAIVPPSNPSKPFVGYGDSSTWASADGWEISLVSFIVPRAEADADGEDRALFGVSLAFRASQLDVPVIEQESLGESSADSVASNVSSAVNQLVGSALFKQKFSGEAWTKRISNEVREDDEPVTVGLVLMSHRNVIPSMRDGLSRFLAMYSLGNDSSRHCGPLVNLLGNFSHQDIEGETLRVLLEPFIKEAASPWLERPIGSQALEFEQWAGKQLLNCLSPIPLSLMFVTAVLEQKIVLSSSRRSLLLAASTALSKMLKPLKWCHLQVPLVPSGLAADLLQYPAPFILGVGSEDPGVMDLIRELPDDVTLVDLDVGRVILAPSFAHNSELGRGTPNNEDTTRALRSQVLYLAQSLGSVFGNVIEPDIWSCDRPKALSGTSHARSPFERLCSVCVEFLEELLAGTASCCYWLEEAQDAAGGEKVDKSHERTVLFDEDRFFHIKNLRHAHGFRPLFRKFDLGQTSSRLSLALDDFDLILEVFLRCQSMNEFIASREKNTMAFAI